MLQTITSIKNLIEASRLNLTDEKILQKEIESVLLAHQFKFQKESKLSSADIIDFLFNESIGMEIKIKGSPKNIYRQLVRYARYEKIQYIILATNRAMGLPQTIEGKPAYLISLSKGWL